MVRREFVSARPGPYCGRRCLLDFFWEVSGGEGSGKTEQASAELACEGGIAVAGIGICPIDRGHTSPVVEIDLPCGAIVRVPNEVRSLGRVLRILLETDWKTSGKFTWRKARRSRPLRKHGCGQP